jgi:2-polyprenyl-6-methoxyphenol hydroxylase-like FAD-dependent oxidoreductase
VWRILGAVGDDDFIEEPARRTPVRHECDVLVVGGGAAGVAAAVSAARAGADVLLVERSNALGGLATGGLIILLLSLDDGRGHPVVGGLCQEVTERLAARGAAYFPAAGEWGRADEALVERDRRFGLVWGRAPHRVRYSVAYDPEAMRLVLLEMLEASGARLLLHAQAAEPIVAGRRVQAVTFQSKAGRFAVRARTVIDASGDGDVFAGAGCAFEREDVLPWLWFVLGGVEDTASAAERGIGFRTPGPGRLLMPWGATEKIARRIDATSPEDLTLAELACRRRVMAEFERLRQEEPGFARAHVCRVAEQLGITESRRLLGRTVLGRDEVDQPKPDAVALTGHWTKYGALYWIPYGALLPRELDNLLVAGRCISVDHRVHHATKEIPACFATGEAAGTAAALANAADIEPAGLPVEELRGRLEAQGAILYV